MSNHLMIFTIGPVQSFIAQARKTQDLWAGSYLLSYLINHSMKQLLKIGIPKEDIIFPDVDSPLQDEIATLPNRVLFFTTEPESTAAKLTEFVNEKFLGICDFAFERLKKKLKEKVEKEFNGADFVNLVPRQTKGFIKDYWVAVPFADGADYAQKYESVESLLRSRKNIKDFDPSEENGIKCPVCGEREALYLEGQNKKQQVLKFWKEISNQIPKINSNETLCSVCLGKRFFPDYLRQAQADKPEDLGTVNFPSTAEVASSGFKHSLIVNKKYSDMEKIFFHLFEATGQKGKLLPKNRSEYKKSRDPAQVIDGHWLYLENYTKREFKALLDDDIRIGKFLAAGKELNEFFKANKLPKISKYYAVFFIDGDSMRDKISRIKSKNQHREFTKAMSEFSTEDVGRIVETEHLGKVIYAGGDDVAALVNINDLLPVLDKLRTCFLEKMRKKIEFIPDSFTMSAGAAVAHYKAPFSLVLNYARLMEQEAKQFDDGKGHLKNALGIYHGDNPQRHQPAECGVLGTRQRQTRGGAN